jgi:hypothetical protein
MTTTWQDIGTADDGHGPVGFRFMEDAPKDGRFVRLRFRRVEGEVRGRWQEHPEMKAGGWWFDADGNYISPGPLYWAPSPPSKEGE